MKTSSYWLSEEVVYYRFVPHIFSLLKLLPSEYEGVKVKNSLFNIGIKLYIYLICNFSFNVAQACLK